MRFANRYAAGRALVPALRPLVSRPAIVYALPRGGVPVAAEIARALDVPLDLVIPRKIGHPQQPEYAICAVTETGQPICNEDERAQVDPLWLERHISAERDEARRRRELYCGGQPRLSSRGCCAVLVDDGIATGLTMRAALDEVRADRPSRVIVAVAVAPQETVQAFADLADEFIAAQIPEVYAGAVGAYYEDFRQLSDKDVLQELGTLKQLRTPHTDAAGA